jgi:regulator of protease activity HflC (stomatin/prohibitin superfamily)
MRRYPILLIGLAALALLAFGTIFIVDERQKAMVLQFGQVRSIKEDPGLSFKVPFVQNVVFYDSRIQGLETRALEVTPLDDRRLIVDAFREVQAARQERSTLQNRADAYANERLASARGESAQTLQQAEGYRAQVVNAAQGEASRFTAVLEEYVKAPDVTRQRLYLETMEGVLGDVQMFLVDTPSGNGQGIVPYLPLNELRRTGGDE